MNRFATLFLAVVLLIVSANRLPAPIVEETPAPTTKPKPKRTPADVSGQKRIVISPFAGIWSGPYVCQCHCSDGTETTLNYPDKISSVTVSAGGKIVNGSPAFMSADAKALTWHFQSDKQAADGVNHFMNTCALHLNSANTATILCERVCTDGPLRGCTFKCTITCTK
jgi:hypothetical protein